MAPGFEHSTQAGHVDRAAPDRRNDALQRVHDYIHAHLCDGIQLDDLAAAACISRFHFARVFRASTGDSPMEYVRKLRVEAAKQMLARGDQKIAATAAALGFCDQSHFTRTFRRMTGVSPRAFSHQHMR